MACLRVLNTGRRLETARNIDNRNRILTITESGGDALFTTAAPHGLAQDETIFIGGTSVSSYVGELTALVIDGPSTFFTGAPYIAPAVGGYWERRHA